MASRVSALEQQVAQLQHQLDAVSKLEEQVVAFVADTLRSSSEALRQALEEGREDMEWLRSTRLSKQEPDPDSDRLFLHQTRRSLADE